MVWVGRWVWIAGLWFFAATPVFGQATPAAPEGREPLPLELRWRAPRECPAATEVRAELERIARARPGYTLRPLAADAQVLRRGGSYHVTLRTEHEGRRGERALVASECKTLVRTVTLVLALAFGAGVELAPSATTDATSGAPGSPTNGRTGSRAAATSTRAPDEVAATASGGAAADSPPLAADAALDVALVEDDEEDDDDQGREIGDDDAAARGPGVRLAWLLGVGGTVKLMPSAGLVASTGPELRLDAWSIGLRALFWPGTATAAGPNVQAHWRGLGGALQACGHAGLFDTLELAACGGGRLVTIRARASGDVRSQTSNAPWTALTAATSLSWPRAHWLRARLELSVALSLSRPRFTIEGLGDTHHIPSLIPELTAAALASF
jgi:hypothetical protein